MIIINLVVMPIFLLSLFVSLTFIFGEEGKDERGRRIVSSAYTYTFPIFPIGWLLLETYHRSYAPLTFVDYRNTLGLLIPLTFIILGSVIFTLKRRV